MKKSAPAVTPEAVTRILLAGKFPEAQRSPQTARLGGGFTVHPGEDAVIVTWHSASNYDRDNARSAIGAALERAGYEVKYGDYRTSGDGTAQVRARRR